MLASSTIPKKEKFFFSLSRFKNTGLVRFINECVQCGEINEKIYVGILLYSHHIILRDKLTIRDESLLSFFNPTLKHILDLSVRNIKNDYQIFISLSALFVFISKHTESISESKQHIIFLQERIQLILKKINEILQALLKEKPTPKALDLNFNALKNKIKSVKTAYHTTKKIFFILNSAQVFIKELNNPVEKTPNIIYRIQFATILFISILVKKDNLEDIHRLCREAINIDTKNDIPENELLNYLFLVGSLISHPNPKHAQLFTQASFTKEITMHLMDEINQIYPQKSFFELIKMNLYYLQKKFLPESISQPISSSILFLNNFFSHRESEIRQIADYSLDFVNSVRAYLPINVSLNKHQHHSDFIRALLTLPDEIISIEQKNRIKNTLPTDFFIEEIKEEVTIEQKSVMKIHHSASDSILYRK